MAKFSLSTIASGFASTLALNTNFTKLQTELDSKVLYRVNPVGEPNQLENDIDMNANRVINLPDGVLDGEPVTVRQGLTGATGSASALAAAISASQAAATLDNLETIYLGSFGTAPVLDNNGFPLVTGQLYYNATDDVMYIRDSLGTWQPMAVITSGYRPIIPVYITGNIAAGEMVVQYVAPQQIVLPINFSDSTGYANVAPTATAVFSVLKNGTVVGTVTFLAGQNVATFVAVAPTTLDIGDRLTITAPTSQDATLDQVSFTFRTLQVTGALISKYSADFYSPSGSGDVVTLAAVGLTVAPDSYSEGMKIAWKTTTINTGPVTVNVAALGAKQLTIGGVQLTAGQLDLGVVNEARFDAVNDWFYLTNRADTLSVLQRWQIGDVYTTTVATNPATTLGYGTWSAFGEGRVLIGAGTGNDGVSAVQFNAGVAGGEYNHSLTSGENGPHVHTGNMGDLGGFGGGWPDSNAAGPQVDIYTTNSSGLGTGHNNIQPYKVVYYWERTA